MLINKIKKILGSRLLDPKLYNIKDIDISEIANYPNGVADMYHRRVDGFYVRNVLSKEQLATLKRNMDNIPEEEKVSFPEGFTFPRIFALLVKNSAFEPDEVIINNKLFTDYFSYCEKLRHSFAERFGVDIEGTVSKVIGAMASGLAVDIPKGFNNNGVYPNVTLRSLNPNIGKIHTHCGNFFQIEFSNFYQHLSTQVKVLDQLSYFIVLQEPEAGGELTLYDIEWDAAKKIHDTGLEKKIVTTNGKIHEVDENTLLKRMFITPRAGDMFMFAGGQIWHRVENIKGNTNRITAGGFFSYATDDSKIMVWS